MLIFFGFFWIIFISGPFWSLLLPHSGTGRRTTSRCRLPLPFPAQFHMRAAEKLPEINPHKKMAASGMEHARRTFYVHAAAPANGGNGRAACCKPPVLCSYLAAHT